MTSDFKVTDSSLSDNLDSDQITPPTCTFDGDQSLGEPERNNLTSQVEIGATSAQPVTAPAVMAVRFTSFAEYLYLLKPFSGLDEDFTIGDFFEEIERVGKIADWDDGSLVTAAKLKLNGEAEQFARFHPAVKHAGTWVSFKQELSKRFGKSADKNLTIKLTQAIQKPNESTRSFLSRVSGLAYRCFPSEERIRNKILFEQALKGLNSNTRRFVMSQSPKTYQDIWDSALQEEQCLDFDKHRAEINSINPVSVENRDSSELAELKQLMRVNMKESEKKINELTEQLTKLTSLVMQTQQPNNTPQMSYPPPFYPPPNFNHYQRPRRQDIVCYRCGEKGHISRVCKLRTENPSLNS